MPDCGSWLHVRDLAATLRQAGWTEWSRPMCHHFPAISTYVAGVGRHSTPGHLAVSLNANSQNWDFIIVTSSSSKGKKFVTISREGINEMTDPRKLLLEQCLIYLGLFKMYVSPETKTFSSLIITFAVGVLGNLWLLTFPQKRQLVSGGCRKDKGGPH